jgi:peptidyl-tRNA hydrolase
MDPANFVLSDFGATEKDMATEMFQNAAEVVEQVLLLGAERAASMIPGKTKEK